MRADDRSEAATKPERSPNPWVLWAVVTVLWTSATLIAIHDGWPQIHGNENAFDSRLVWLCLLLPPFIFAVVIAATFSLKLRPKRGRHGSRHQEPPSRAEEKQL